MFIEENKLKEFIIDSGLVSPEDLDLATEESNKDNTTLADYLVSEGKINEDDLKRVQAYILGIPFIDAGSNKIPYEILSIIPEPIARKHNIIAFDKDGQNLEVAMLDTDDLAAVAEGKAQSQRDGRSGKEDWQQTVINSTVAEEATPPDVVDTWHFRPFEGLDSFGIEFVMASAHSGSDPDASGRRYHMHIAVDSDANTVTEIVFAAPERHWQEAWRQHGKDMVENMYLNWEDSSPYKMS
jgi:hypothetical protein